MFSQEVITSSPILLKRQSGAHPELPYNDARRSGARSMNLLPAQLPQSVPDEGVLTVSQALPASAAALAAAPAAALAAALAAAAAPAPVQLLVQTPMQAPLQLPPAKDPRQPAGKGPHKAMIASVVSLAVLALSVGGYQWLGYLSTHQDTDDAYTTGHMHSVSSRINDTVDKVLVDDNEHVKAGQVLVLLDPRDFQVRLDAAMAALKTAQHQAQAAKVSIDLADTTASGKSTQATGGVSNAQSTINKAVAVVAEAKSSIPQAQAMLAEKQAEEVRAAADYRRFDVLATEGAVSLQQRDQALRDYKVAQEATRGAQEAIKQAVSRLEEAEQAVGAARAQLVESKGILQQAEATHVQTAVNVAQYEVAQSAISQAKAQLADAQLQLSYTKIVAPVNGRIGKKTVEEGQRVQPGQQMMQVVADDVWVLANFKETQLERMRSHQPVVVKIDAFPHHEFKATVDSFSPGSGASFSLLPPDNATGNFTKIVQRVPVKVVFDRDSVKGYEQLLTPGMSAVVTVVVGK